MVRAPKKLYRLLRMCYALQGMQCKDDSCLKEEGKDLVAHFLHTVVLCYRVVQHGAVSVNLAQKVCAHVHDDVEA